MGLFEFCHLPFGLTGSPGTFQRLMDHILRGLNFVMVYIDNVLIYSADEHSHKQHLRKVFRWFKKHGLTFHGEKCQIGFSQVSYLGHVFSKEGMAPDINKVKVIQDWPIPTTVTEVQQFLGLASYYCRYVQGFANISAPLYELTNKGAVFHWTNDCQAAFHTLKSQLMTFPILRCPDFSSTFTLYTDASDKGLGAVLQQDSHVIAYASRSLKPSEKNYSVIERECLYAVKYFKHYLLGRHFTVYTDHSPLQWLSAQKMEGRLSRWALRQEYEFEICYWKGSSNTIADALSQVSCLATKLHCGPSDSDLVQAQTANPVIRNIIFHLQNDSSKQQRVAWRHPQYKRWLQLWSQLLLRNNILYRRITLPVSQQKLLVPIAPESLGHDYLQQFHDAPLGGHQGYMKTLSNL